MVVLRDLRSGFGTFDGERIIPSTIKGGIWRGDLLGGVRQTGRVLESACWRAVAGFKGEAVSSGSARGDVERGVWTSERVVNLLLSSAGSTVSGQEGHLDKLASKMQTEYKQSQQSRRTNSSFSVFQA